MAAAPPFRVVCREAVACPYPAGSRAACRDRLNAEHGTAAAQPPPAVERGDRMRAIVFDQPGDEDVLHIGEAPSPPLGAEEIRIRVHATAVNRADLLQRQGFYP